MTFQKDPLKFITNNTKVRQGKKTRKIFVQEKTICDVVSFGTSPD
jgi:hypothetical protein